MLGEAVNCGPYVFQPSEHDASGFRTVAIPILELYHICSPHPYFLAVLPPFLASPGSNISMGTIRDVCKQFPKIIPGRDSPKVPLHVPAHSQKAPHLRLAPPKEGNPYQPYLGRVWRSLMVHWWLFRSFDEVWCLEIISNPIWNIPSVSNLP